MYGKRGALNNTSKRILDLTTGIIYESAMLASDELDLNFSHVCAVARGKRGSHKDHVFRYVDENNNIIQPESIAYIKSRKVKDSILPEYLQYIE